jgi:hypothetical protein
MQSRCYDLTSQHFKNYGGRGIQVCDEWLGENGLDNFREWAISSGYRKGLTIDRIDNSKNYSPDNCRWVDMKTQCQNRRKWGTDTHNHKLITWDYNGETHTIAEWSEITGIDEKILRTRKYKGWEIERILTTPPMDYALTLKRGR